MPDAIWNAAHWDGEGYAQLFEDFSAAPDVDTQKSLAGQIQSLLWEEVP
ncbi:MAG: hypothetical protein GWN58_19200, partial [Anaerolineae bacterium]|nr:hypothetical protein [Anaerolineae bacterium]